MISFWECHILALWLGRERKARSHHSIGMLGSKGGYFKR